MYIFALLLSCPIYYLNVVQRYNFLHIYQRLCARKLLLNSVFMLYVIPILHK